MDTLVRHTESACSFSTSNRIKTVQPGTGKERLKPVSMLARYCLDTL
jgi:hypothetical protein